MINHNIKADDRLLATFICNNPEFETACNSRDGDKLIMIVDAEIEKNKLHTKGAAKLRSDIIRMMMSKKSFTEIMFFVWNSRLSGTGFGVI